MSFKFSGYWVYLIILIFIYGLVSIVLDVASL